MDIFSFYFNLQLAGSFVAICLCIYALVWQQLTKHGEPANPFYSSRRLVAYLFCIGILLGSYSLTNHLLAQLFALGVWGFLILPRKPSRYPEQSLPALLGGRYGRATHLVAGTLAAACMLAVATEVLANHLTSSPFSILFLLLMVGCTLAFSKTKALTIMQQIGMFISSIMISITISQVVHLAIREEGSTMIAQLWELPNFHPQAWHGEFLCAFLILPLLLQPLLGKGRQRNFQESLGFALALLATWAFLLKAVDAYPAAYAASRAHTTVVVTQYMARYMFIVAKHATLLYLTAYYITQDVLQPLRQSKELPAWQHYAVYMVLPFLFWGLAASGVPLSTNALLYLVMVGIPPFLLLMVGLTGKEAVFYTSILAHVVLITILEGLGQGSYLALSATLLPLALALATRYQRLSLGMAALLSLGYRATMLLSGINHATTFSPLYYSCMLALQLLLYLAIQYYMTGTIAWVQRRWDEDVENPQLPFAPTKEGIRHLLWSVLNIPSCLLQYTQHQRMRYGYLPHTFFFWIILTTMLPLGAAWTETSELHLLLITLHTTALLMLLIASTKTYWPVGLMPLHQPYTYLTLSYTLIFVPALTYLVMDVPSPQLIPIALNIILLATLVDRGTFLLLTSSALLVLYAFITYQVHPSLKYGWEVLQGNPYAGHLVRYTYVSAITIGLLFGSYKQKVRTEKRLLLSRFGSQMIHLVTNLIGLSKSHAHILEDTLRGMKVTHHKGGDKVTMTCTAKDYAFLIDTLEQIQNVHHHGELTTRSYALPYHPIDKEDFAPYSALACLEDAIHLFKQRLGASINITLDTTHDFTFQGIDTCFKEAIIGLLDNARRFGGPGCPVHIWLQSNTIYVEDHGPGIAKHVFPHIFVEFYSTHNSALGMGLPFVVNTIEAFGGWVRCDSSNHQPYSYTRLALHLPSQAPSASLQQGPSTSPPTSGTTYTSLS